ncbi:MAG: HAD hydrolase family protein [Elusimicrobia bacterium]|nr:HAD hydrolase family protein [Elusimicrobiota bacterium]
MNLLKKASKIKIFIMDVDGVLTDGKMYFFREGKEAHEIKAFNAQDGIGLMLLNKFAVKTGIITGRESAGAEERAKMLSMSYAYQGFLSKIKPLEEIMACENLKYEEAAYMGDDLTDLPVLKRVGLACCPHNSVPQIKKVCDFVSSKNGGDGAVREVCDLIIKAKGLDGAVMKGVEEAVWPQTSKISMKTVLYSRLSRGKR